MITIELQSDRVTPALDRLAQLLDDLTPVMDEIGEYLIAATRARFAEGKGPDGTPWAPKSEATIAAYKARKDPVDHRPLFGPTGALSSQFSTVATPDSVEIGTNLIYAAVMQFGAEAGQFGARMGTDKRGRSFFMPIPWGDIPARPFLGLSDDDETAILSIVTEWLESATA